MKGAGGGKRGGRKPKRVDSDDRPRGYEATRMRQLWHDIDHAKHKAGLGRAPEPAAPPGWDVAAIIEQAAVLIGGAATWVTANVPAALALLRGVPLVGRLVELMPPAAPPQRDHPAAGPPSGHTNGTVHSVTSDPDEIGDPDGGWIH